MKTKQILMTIAAFFFILFIKGQEKYEYLTVEYITWNSTIAISIDGKDFTKEKVDYAKHDKSGYNANPLLEKVKEYENKGWEVFTLNLNHAGQSGAEAYYAFMRKKKTDK